MTAKDSIDWQDVEPCDKCGSLMLWWDVFGKTHCMKCDPAPKSIAVPRQHKKRATKPGKRKRK